jgi:hypothetical protein
VCSAVTDGLVFREVLDLKLDQKTAPLKKVSWWFKLISCEYWNSSFK